MKAPRAALLAGLGLAALASSEEAGVQAVNVGGLTAFNDLLVVHPKALVGVTYDTNIQGTSPASGDEILRVMVGASALLHLDEQVNAVADAELDDLRYRTTNSLDMVGGTANVKYQQRGSQAQLTVLAGLNRDESRQLETGTMVMEQVYRAEANATYKALASSYGVDLSASRLQYLEDTALFTAAQGSHDDFALGLTAGWDYARETGIFLHVIASDTQYLDHTIYDDSYGGALRLGWRGAVGDRSLLRAEAGIDYRRYLDTAGKLPPYDQQNAWAPALALGLTWPWAERSRLEAVASSTVVDGATSDAAWGMDLGVHLAQELGRALSCGVDADLAQLRNLSAPSGAPREIRTTLTLSCGVDLRQPSGLVFHLGGKYLDSRSTTAISYLDFQLISELAYAY